MVATATHPAASSATVASVHRVTGASTARVTQCGNGNAGLSAENRGLRQANATTAKVNVSAQAAPMSA